MIRISSALSYCITLGLIKEVEPEIMLAFHFDSWVLQGGGRIEGDCDFDQDGGVRSALEINKGIECALNAGEAAAIQVHCAYGGGGNVDYIIVDDGVEACVEHETG